MDNYRSRQKQHLLEKYGHLREKQNKKENSQISISLESVPKLKAYILSLESEKREELLSIVERLLILAQTGGAV